MGAWGAGLYQNDTAEDLKADFADEARFPIDASEIVTRLVRKHRIMDESDAVDAADFWLVLADLLHRHAMDHPETFARARALIETGAALDAKRAVEMSERDLDRRAAVLADLLVAWAKPHPKPKARKVMKGPEAFALQPGEVWVWPTMNGAARPWFAWNMTEEIIAREFRPDGWGGLVCAETWHDGGFLARYLVAFLHFDGAAPPDPSRIADTPPAIMISPERALDDRGQSAFVERDVPMVFSTYFWKSPARHLKLSGATRTASVGIDPEKVRATSTDPETRRQLTVAEGHSSLEHLMTLSSFHHHWTAFLKDPLPRFRPSGDIRLADLA